MKRLVKVTIRDFSKLKENLNDIAELSLYEQANGHIYEAEIEHDGYAVIDLPDGDYIELADDEYELMIEDWKKAGQVGNAILMTKSDPFDDMALLYRLQDANGQVVQDEQSLSKTIVRQLAEVWFSKQPKKEQ